MIGDYANPLNEGERNTVRIIMNDLEADDLVRDLKHILQEWDHVEDMPSRNLLRIVERALEQRK